MQMVLRNLMCRRALDSDCPFEQTSRRL
jgi:hypothetical protein